MGWIFSKTGGLQSQPHLRSFIHPRSQIRGLQGLLNLCVFLHRSSAISLTCASAVGGIATRFLIVTTPQRGHPVVLANSLPCLCRETPTALMCVGSLNGTAMVLTTRSTASPLPCLCRGASTAFVRVGSLIGTAMVLTTRSTASPLPCLC